MTTRAIDRERVSSAFESAREQVESELSAASEGLRWGPRGLERLRKWVGWALFRIAMAVNPEIRDA
jgi:hypothetical protein